MFTQRTIAIVVCAVGLTLAGCSSGEPTTSASRVTNADLEKAVHDRLGPDPRLNDVVISADAAKNQVTLSGRVETQDLHAQALDAVRSVSPTLQVADNIDVKPREIARTDYTEDMAREARERAKSIGEKIGSSLDDAWVHTRILGKLLADKDTPAHAINIDVVNGIVTLRGKVDTAAAKGEAERIAKETDGVKRVVNHIEAPGT